VSFDVGQRSSWQELLVLHVQCCGRLLS